MAKRLVNTVLRNNNYKYRLEIVDLYSSASDTDYKIEISVPGPALSYDGDLSNHTTPVLGSSLQFTAFLTQAQRNVIMGTMYSDKEYALAVGYYLYDENDSEHLEWSGIILPDETVETIESGGGYVTVTFKCTDGLPVLNHVNFLTETGQFYTGEYSLAFWLKEVFKKLPHFAYYHGGTTQEFMKEVGLPVPSDDTYTFDTTANTLDSSYVRAGTFYGDKKRLNTKRILPTPSESFSSTYSVLEDIMLSMGASVMLTRGCWYVINRSYFALEVATSDQVPISAYSNTQAAPYYEVSDYDESFIIDIGEHENFVVSGATRTGLFPYRGATMIHKNAGSDLIFARGVGYNGYDGLDPIINQPMFSSDGWSTSSDYDMDYVGTNINSSNIDGLNIPSGYNGVLTIAMSGYITFDKKSNASSSASSTHGIGACPIVRNLIQITDSNGKSWRLKRHVLTLNSFQCQINESSFMDTLGYVLGGGSGVSNVYYPKYYENNGAYTWVGDDETGYSSTYFETMIGLDPDVVEEGATERFLEVDYLNTKFYTPIKTEVGENDEPNDNVLSVRHNEDRARYVWKINSNVEMPTLTTGYISDFNWEAHQLLVYAPERGIRPTGDGTYTINTGVHFTTDSTDHTTPGYSVVNSKYEPIEYIVYGCSVRIGDGTEAADLQYVAFDLNNNGTEVHSIGEGRIGSTKVNRYMGTNGKIWARLYDGSTQLTDKTDLLNWSPRYDIAEKEDALLYLNCAEFMQTRHKTRQVISMGIINNSGIYNNFIRPINLLRTSVLASGGEEILMPIGISKNLENLSAEFIRVDFSRDALLEAVDVSGKGPEGNNPTGPGITDGNDDGPTSISNVKSLLATANNNIGANTLAISNQLDLVKQIYETYNVGGLGGQNETKILYSQNQTDGGLITMGQTSVSLSAGATTDAISINKASTSINYVGFNNESPTSAVDVVGDIKVTGTVDGVDVSALKSTVDSLSSGDTGTNEMLMIFLEK